MSVILWKKQQKEENRDEEEEDDVMKPPINFSMVEEGLYRSGFPEPSNFGYLKTLNLKSIIYLCSEQYPEEYMKFLECHKIQLFQLGMEGTKETIPKDAIYNALNILIDVRNYPILIHCKRGKHRTGCVVGCYRKLQNWCMKSVFEEYQHYAGGKARSSDMNFMQEYDVLRIRQSLHSRIYQYHGYGSNKRRLLDTRREELESIKDIVSSTCRYQTYKPRMSSPSG